MDVLSTDLWNMFKHVRTWLNNLDRANDYRKRESVDALRAVVHAIRETESYLRKIREENRDHDSEARLSSLWTELSYRLRDIGIEKLADKCYLKGKFWADRENYINETFSNKSVISLQMMEHLANKQLRSL